MTGWLACTRRDAGVAILTGWAEFIAQSDEGAGILPAFGLGVSAAWPARGGANLPQLCCWGAPNNIVAAVSALFRS